MKNKRILLKLSGESLAKENGTGIDYHKLLEIAEKARENSYSPYSNFKVGAALLTKSGKVFTGCNVECASFSATNCAERTAFYNAIINSEKDFSKIAVVGGKGDEITDFCLPCGVCRQVMSEFCNKDFEIICFNGKEVKKFGLDEILPFGFNLE